MRPVGIGVVGLGRWGRNYVKTLLALPECRLVAVADADPGARDHVRAETGVAVHGSADELLSDPAVEAVVVAAPDHTHYGLASSALAAGRDVLVEKPMALEPCEAEALAEQAEAGSHVLAVGHTAVYAADLGSLRVRLDALPPDVPRRVAAERTSSGPGSAHSSLVHRPSSILFDLCPHDVALAVLLFGAPVAARARSNRNRVEYEVRFQGNTLLAGYAEWREPPHVRRFEMADAGNALSDAIGNPDSLDVRETPLGRQCLDFVQCCRTRRQPLSSGRVGLAVIRCISTLAASCADGNAWLPLSSGLRTPTAERRTPDFELRDSELGVRT